MRFGVIFSIFISLVTITAAIWVRAHKESSSINPSIVSANDFDLPSDQYLQNLTGENAGGEILSNTDLISRQLILNYLDLAQNGRATQGNIYDLAQKYIEEVPTLHSATYVNLSEIAKTEDSKASFTAYEERLNLIHKKFAEKMAPYKGIKLNTLNAQFFSFASAVSQAYYSAADELKKMKVPSSIAPTHLQLINKYISSAEAMKSLSKADTDPVSAFAGIAIMNNNFSEGEKILTEISIILNRP